MSTGASDAAFTTGSLIDRYRVEGLLGEGGMGAVYAVVDPSIGRRFALKVLRPSIAAEAGMVARLEREARATADLHHPAIVEILHLGRTEDGRPYVVMPLLEGKTLREELDVRKRLLPHEAWAILREVGDALAAAHEAGIVHRDLKPENIFLERSLERSPDPARGRGAARVRLLDFGIAKIDPALASDPASLVKLTQTGMPLGTPVYMAPEQWWCQPVDGRTDQYAFGAVLFELLTGRPPFTSRHFAELLQMHLHEPPPELSAAETGGEPAVAALVERLLAKKAEDRFADFEEVLAQGDEAFHLEVAPPPSSPEAPRATPPETTAFAATQLASSTGDPRAELAATVAVADGEARTSTTSPQRTRPRNEAVGGRGARWIFAAATALGLGGLVLLGYPGDAGRNVARWFEIGGAGMILFIPSLVAAMIAIASAARLRERRRGDGYGRCLAALLPAVAMGPATYMGWAIVRRTAESAPDLGQSFTIVSTGTYELNTARFVGFALTSIPLVAVAALAGVRTEGRPAPVTPLGKVLHRGLPLSLAVVTASFGAALAMLLAAPAAAPLFVVAAFVFGLDVVHPIRVDDRSRRDVLHRSLASVAALLAATGLGAARSEASDAWLWQAGTTRSERIEALLAADRENVWLAYCSLIVLSVYVAYAALRLAQQPEPRAPGRLPLAAWIGVALLPVLTAMDVVFHGQFFEVRRRAVEGLGESLATGMNLSPPPAPPSVTAQPVVAPAIQVTRDAVSLDGKAIARLSALSSTSVQQSVLHDLTNAAASTARSNDGARHVDLSLLVDRTVSWSNVALVLSLAREAGATEVQVLLTRGEAPVIPEGAPREAGLLLPTDFAALDAQLADEGFETEPTRSFEEAAEALAARAGGASGPVQLRAPKR